MCLWFVVSIVCMCLMVPIHFLSVEHLKLQDKYGKEKGIIIGDIFGMVSGWGFFIFWFGVWISPQYHFTIPLFDYLQIDIPIINFSIPLIHLIISVPFIIVGAWFGIGSVRETTLKVSETHRAEKVVSSGLYEIIRHPQYFGGILAHIGITFLLSSFLSLLTTPIVVFLNYLVSWKEEKELIKEFGKEYEDYKKKVPMFIPKLRRKTKEKKNRFK